MDFAASKGVGCDALAKRSGIHPVDLEDQDNRIPFAKYVVLMRAAKDACNDPAFALHFGEAVACSDMTVVGLICAASESVMEGFAQLNRYARLVVEVDTGTSDRIRLARADDGLWVIDTR